MLLFGHQAYCSMSYHRNKNLSATLLYLSLFINVEQKVQTDFSKSAQIFQIRRSKKVWTKICRGRNFCLKV